MRAVFVGILEPSRVAIFATSRAAFTRLQLRAASRRAGSWRRFEHRFLRGPYCHVYFEIDARAQMIRIVHAWDGRRESTPEL